MPQILRMVVLRLVAIFLTLNVLIWGAYVLVFYNPVNGLAVALAAYDGIHLSAGQLAAMIWQVTGALWTLNVHDLQLTERVTRIAFLHAVETSLFITLASIAAAALIGVPLGAWAAWRRDHWLAQFSVSLSIAVSQVPPMAVVVALLWVLVLDLRWLPALGWGRPIDAVLPVLTLTVVNLGYITKFMQTGMNNVLTRDFIQAARARGASAWRIVVRHALRPAVVTVVTFFGPQTVLTILAVALVERTLDVPGVARLLGIGVSYLGTPQPPGSQGAAVVLITADVFVIGGFILLLNFLIDLVYRLLEPGALW
jgi:ABC-type dipeptide/oligopeptide/nickel transport system permease component